jgi:hypothetical protein
VGGRGAAYLLAIDSETERSAWGRRAREHALDQHDDPFRVHAPIDRIHCAGPRRLPSPGILHGCAAAGISHAQEAGGSEDEAEAEDSGGVHQGPAARCLSVTVLTTASPPPSSAFWTCGI